MSHSSWCPLGVSQYIDISVYHIPSTVYALRTLFYCHLEQALAVLPVSQTRAETGANTQEVDLSPRLRVISALQFQSLFSKKIAYFTFNF